MNETNIDSSLKSISISGTSVLDGGEYGTLRVSGSFKGNGDIKCNEFHSSGSSTFKGDLETETFRSSGSSRIDGKLVCTELYSSGAVSCESAEISEKLHLSGGLKMSGDLNAGTIKVSGGLNCANLHCEQAHISGGCCLQGNLETEYLHCTGKIIVPGLLNSEKIEIAPVAGSSIGTIGGSDIKILIPDNTSNPLGVFGLFEKRHASRRIDVSIIEGDKIELEATHAKIVRGNDVKIGEGCKIDLVEYTGTLTAEEGTVIKIVKI